MYLTVINSRLSDFLITNNERRSKWPKNLMHWLFLARTLLLQKCAKLVDFIKNIILDDDFVARHKKNKSDFTRERSLPFFNVVVFLLNLLRSSLQNELDKFFHTLSDADVPVREVTASAFCQARKKLKHQAFIELNARSTDYFYNNFEALRWHGFRLLAADGSTTQLPKTTRNWKYFGGIKPAAGGQCPMARL